jgi:retinol dehydrogenase 12
MPRSNLSRFWDQSFRIPQPTLTEKNLPDQSGRVVIVTGGYTGIGYELSKILYQRNATIYLAGRSPSKAEKAVEKLKKEFPDSKGRLEVLKVDLGDLSTIKGSADEFLGKEQRLDVLVNNGSRPKTRSKSYLTLTPPSQPA